MTPFSPLAALPSLTEAAGVAVDAAAAASKQAAVGALTGGLLGGLSLSSVVIIVLGLLLIAAGLFSMEKTRALIVQGGKAAAAVAA